ncbi:MAG TPA: hypothetical protein DFS52_30285, partial [Myxococcales bacterium]|nr:hypothetical protein [Myxococcales bacterium]
MEDAPRPASGERYFTPAHRHLPPRHARRIPSFRTSVCSQTPPKDEEMKVAITGGSGHVGGNLARALLAEGHEVRALVRE